jgi:hypothetical protein
MRYERPGIEQRVKVMGPVIAGLNVPGRSGTTVTPTWAPHE